MNQFEKMGDFLGKTIRELKDQNRIYREALEEIAGKNLDIDLGGCRDCGGVQTARKALKKAEQLEDNDGN